MSEEDKGLGASPLRGDRVGGLRPEPAAPPQPSGRSPHGAARFIFVGEKPSPTAERKGWTWDDGRVAARTLHTALQVAGIEPAECGFTNLFGQSADAPERPTDEVTARADVLRAASRAGVVVVALGKKVARQLERNSVPHVPLIHPAARGEIRGRDRYVDHVCAVLVPVLEQAA